MKNTRRFLIWSAITLVGCISISCSGDLDSEIDILKRKLDSLEEKCSTINTNIKSLQEMVAKMESCIYITSIREITQGREVVGYKIMFSDGEIIQFTNGTNVSDPVVGLKQWTDGLYYWTVNYGGETEFVLDEFGQMVTATGSTPELKIENGYWMISYDGVVWNKLGKAEGESGKSFISEIADSLSYFKITFVSNEVMRVPSWAYYEQQKSQFDKLNSDLATLQALYDAIKDNVYLSSVIPVKDNDGTVMGYKFKFSDGKEFTVNNAVPGNCSVEIRTDTDGKMYWQMTYPDGTQKWILNSFGQKLEANPQAAKSPTFGIERDTDGNYYWMVSYEDGVYSWIFDESGKKVAASSNSPSVFSDIAIKDDYVEFSVQGGTKISMPRYPSIIIEAPESLSIKEGNSVNVNFTIKNAKSILEVAAISSDDFVATISKRQYNASSKTMTGVITLDAPKSFTTTSSKLLLLVSDGVGHIQNYLISIVCEK